MRNTFCSCILIVVLTTPALADPKSTNTQPRAYRSLGTCLASPEGFNSKLEPVNSGVAWTTTITTVGHIDDRGAAAEIGQAVDTASFGVGPRMHMPGAHAYKDTFTAAISKSEKDGSSTFRAEAISGTFTAGPNVGRGFTLSSFELKMIANDNGTDVYVTNESPTIQTFSLSGGVKFDRICVLTVWITEPR